MEEGRSAPFHRGSCSCVPFAEARMEWTKKREKKRRTDERPNLKTARVWRQTIAEPWEENLGGWVVGWLGCCILLFARRVGGFLWCGPPSKYYFFFHIYIFSFFLLKNGRRRKRWRTASNGYFMQRKNGRVDMGKGFETYRLIWLGSIEFFFSWTNNWIGKCLVLKIDLKWNWYEFHNMIINYNFYRTLFTATNFWFIFFLLNQSTKNTKGLIEICYTILRWKKHYTRILKV